MDLTIHSDNNYSYLIYQVVDDKRVNVTSTITFFNESLQMLRFKKIAFLKQQTMIDEIIQIGIS